jgi:hypothetical protein
MSERSLSSANGSASQSNFSTTRSHDIGRVGEPSLTHYWIVSATAVRNAEPPAMRYTFEFCVPDNAHARPVVSRTVSSAGAPGYWRLWRPAGNRIKVECRFDGADDLVPCAVRHASYDAATGEYADWQEREVR